jgi:Flp pilus assembly protein TadG
VAAPHTGANGRNPRPLADASGTVSIEFAVLFPVFLALLFGMIVFGAQYSVRMALTYAAAEGGRAAMAGLDDAERQALASAAVQETLKSLAPLVDPEKAEVQIAFADQDDGEEITVSIGYSDHRFARLPFVPSLDDLPPVTVRYLATDPLG